MSVLAGARVVTRDGVLEPGWVEIAGDRITGVGSGVPPSNAGAVDDLGGAWLLPGYVDLHVHGGNGGAIEESAEGLARSVAFHRSHGTTRTLASVVTAPVEQMAAAAGWIADAVAAGPTPHGHVLGVHYEGPFLSAPRCGAQDPTGLLDPDPAVMWRLLEAARGTTAMVTIAPELPGGTDLIQQVTATGVVAAIGHTDARYADAAAGIAAGATVLTHTFNGMRGMHHRDPGAVGAAADTRTVAEAINDGMHLHDSTVRLLAAVFAGRLALVTDAMAAAGMGDGDYRLGAQSVTVTGGRAVLTGADSIAGSTLTMDRAVSRAVLDVGLPIEYAAHAAATVPAGVLGCDGEFGSIAPGLAADLVVLDDRLEVVRVMAAGMWSEPEEPSR